eukprot:6185785-Pleurochrysis_carterae.AAC.1
MLSAKDDELSRSSSESQSQSVAVPARNFALCCADPDVFFRADKTDTDAAVVLPLCCCNALVSQS